MVFVPLCFSFLDAVGHRIRGAFRRPRIAIVLGVLTFFFGSGNALSQFVEGTFATPEEELRAVIDEATDVEEPGRDALAALFAPLTIIPGTPPSDGLEWAHYDGRYTNDAARDFVWGQVGWRVVEREGEVTIVAGFSIAERNTVGTMTVSRIDPQIRDAIRIEVQLRTDWSEQNTIIPQLRASSRVAINPTPVEGIVDPLGRIVAEFPAAMLFFVSDAVGFETQRLSGRYATIMLSLGATGRAVFDEAMAAWGIARTE